MRCGRGRHPAGSAKPAKLDTWTILRPGPTFDAFKAVTADFSAAHPSISFEVTTIPGENSRRDNRDKLIAAVAAGVPPDVVHETGTPQTAALGGLAELTSYVKRNKSYNPGDIHEARTSRCEFFGQVFGVPVICDSRAMWFNNPPKTWSDLEQAATRLTVRNGDDIQQIGYIPTYGNVDLYSYIFMNVGGP